MAKQQAEPTQEAYARRKRVTKAQAAKRQAESTGQEAGARRKKEAEAQVAKRQTESTQEADARTELPRPRQLSANLDRGSWYVMCAKSVAVTWPCAHCFDITLFLDVYHYLLQL